MFYPAGCFPCHTTVFPPFQHRSCTYSPHSFTVSVQTGSQTLELTSYVTSLYGWQKGPTGLLPMMTFLPLPAAHACRDPATETAFAKTSLNSVTQVTDDKQLLIPTKQRAKGRLPHLPLLAQPHASRYSIWNLNTNPILLKNNSNPTYFHVNLTPRKFHLLCPLFHIGELSYNVSNGFIASNFCFLMLSEDKLTYFQYVGIRRKSICSQKSACSLPTDIHHVLRLDAYITPPAHYRALREERCKLVTAHCHSS